MHKKAYEYLKNVLGDDFLETLEKTELYKPRTNTTVDPEEFHLALRVVPKTVMKFLAKELIPMKIGDTKSINLLVGNSAILEVKKIEKDLYSGEFIEENKKVAEFYSRTLPGIGLYMLTTFELYDILHNEMDNASNPNKDIDEKISKMIDEKLALRDVVQKEVSVQVGKIVSQMDNKKDKVEVTKEESIEVSVAPDIVDVPMEIKAKGSPIVNYLKNRKKKKKKKEYFVEIAKHEKVHCPYCRNEIFNNSGFSGCICFGDNRDSKVYLAKSENGVKISFGAKWDYENIEMLLKLLWRRNQND